ncbi:MAG: NUDIX hydrolase, partial [Methylobacterium sp.]
MDENAFLKAYDPNAFERPALTVDLVLLGLWNGHPAVLLIERVEGLVRAHEA